MARIYETSFNFTAINQTSPWLKHDVYEPPFNVTLAVYFGTGLAGTLAVQFVVDNMGADWQRTVFASQATTVITVSDPGPPGSNNTHGLAVGDVVRMPASPFGLGGLGDGLDFPVASVISATSYTLTSTISQTVVGQNVNNVASGRVFTHATLTALTTRGSGSYGFPVHASRLLCSAFTSGGFGYLEAAQGGTSS